MLVSSGDIICHCKTWQGIELLQLIIFKQQKQLQIQKTSFNYTKLQLSQYTSTLCWIVLIMTVNMKLSYCLKDFKILFTRKIKVSSSDQSRLVLKLNTFQKISFLIQNLKILKAEMIHGLLFAAKTRKRTFSTVAKSHIAINVKRKGAWMSCLISNSLLASI